MVKSGRILGTVLLAAGLPLLVDQLACHGGSSSQAAPGPDFTLSLAAGNVYALPGSSASVTVVAGRANGESGAITLSVDGLPNGVTAAGSIPAGATAGQLTFSLTSSVAAQAFPGLVVKGTDGARSHGAATTLSLSVLPVQTVAGTGSDLVQASGGAQSGTGTQNAVLLGEPFAVGAASSGAVENRTGFTPPPPQ